MNFWSDFFFFKKKGKLKNMCNICMYVCMYVCVHIFHTLL